MHILSKCDKSAILTDLCNFKITFLPLSITYIHVDFWIVIYIWMMYCSHLKPPKGTCAIYIILGLTNKTWHASHILQIKPCSGSCPYTQWQWCLCKYVCLLYSLFLYFFCTCALKFQISLIAYISWSSHCFHPMSVVLMLSQILSEMFSSHPTCLCE